MVCTTRVWGIPKAEYFYDHMLMTTCWVFLWRPSKCVWAYRIVPKIRCVVIIMTWVLYGQWRGIEGRVSRAAQMLLQIIHYLMSCEVFWSCTWHAENKGACSKNKPQHRRTSGAPVTYQEDSVVRNVIIGDCACCFRQTIGSPGLCDAQSPLPKSNLLDAYPINLLSVQGEGGYVLRRGGGRRMLLPKK